MPYEQRQQPGCHAGLAHERIGLAGQFVKAGPFGPYGDLRLGHRLPQRRRTGWRRIVFSFSGGTLRGSDR